MYQRLSEGSGNTGRSEGNGEKIMAKIMAILFRCGAGYIGSHVNKMLSSKGYETVVFDSFVYSHQETVK